VDVGDAAASVMERRVDVNVAWAGTRDDVARREENTTLQIFLASELGCKTRS
jgi:ABC-type phosphate/phosphonate transport system substrate-binding protein